MREGPLRRLRHRWLAVCAAALAAVALPRAQSAPGPGLAAFDEVWRTVNDSYYDPSFGGLDWAAVRDELRPKAAAAPTMDEARRVITAMLGRLKQSHFAVIPRSGSLDDDIALGGEAVVDLDVRLLGGEAVVTAVGGRVPAGPPLQAGSRIIAIDGRAFPPAPAASDAERLHQWRRINAALHGDAGSPAALDIVDPSGARRRVSLPRVMPRGTRVQFGNLPPMRARVDRLERRTPGGRRVGVIGFNIWMAHVDAPIADAIDAFRRADGLVIDLRGNPGGLAAMIMGVAGHVVDRPDVLGTMRTRQVPRLQFVVNPRRSTADGRAVTPFAGPVAILVDELTASASECFAGALQDLGRARVFGRTSMGQALPASTRLLVNGDVLEYAVGDFLTSTGRSLEGRGVVPDEAQPLSVATLAAGVDAPLAAALTWIDRIR